MPSHIIKNKKYTYTKPSLKALEDLTKIIEGTIKGGKPYIENEKEENFFYLLGLVLSDGYNRGKYIYFERSDCKK